MKKFFTMSFMLGLPALVALIDFSIIYGNAFYRSALFGASLILLNVIAFGIFIIAMRTMPKIKKGKFTIERVPAISLGIIYPEKKNKLIGIVLPFCAITYSLK